VAGDLADPAARPVYPAAPSNPTTAPYQRV